MNSIRILFIVMVLIMSSNGSSYDENAADSLDGSEVSRRTKIYSNFAEIVQPLGKLPLEFSTEDWSDIRADSITLVGSKVTITQQTVTEKKESLNNAQVYVRAPSSSSTKTTFIKATIVDAKRNLVKAIDKEVSEEPTFFKASSSDFIYENEPPQTKYYVNFTYASTDPVYVSYLRSNLNWNTHYRLNLFEESKPATLTAMADIRNDGESKVDIQSAELLAGDINLHVVRNYRGKIPRIGLYPLLSGFSKSPSVGQGEEVAGLYVFTVNQPFSIEAKTNFLLPMFHSKVQVDRYHSISKYFYAAGNSTGKGERSYRLVSDQFLSGGNCLIREYDRLVGETSLPDLAAKNKQKFSIGQDADIVYKENAVLISSLISNITTSVGKGIQIRTRTLSTYEINLTLKNYKKNRAAKVEYQQEFRGNAVKLIKPYTDFTQVGSTVNGTFTLAAGEEKSLKYKIKVLRITPFSVSPFPIQNPFGSARTLMDFNEED